MIAILRTKCILMTREYIALFFSIIFCPMLMLIFGMVYGNDPSEMFGGQGTVDVMLPSFVGLVFAGTGLISLPVAVSGSKERGELRRYKMTPLSPMSFLAADVIMYFLISVIGMGIVLLIGRFGYNCRFTGNVFLLLYGFVLSGLAVFAIGLFIAAVSKTAKIAQTVGMVIGFPMMFLSGASMPIEFMPDAMDKVVKAMPLSYSVSMMRDIWDGAGFADLKGDSIVLLAVAVVFTAATAVTFKWE
ncbi:MAG: ABC transporter permease [Anaerovoracaceae bacterium]